MKVIYLIAGLLVFLKMIFINPTSSQELNFNVVQAIIDDAGIPNTVSAIILRNRLYDTVFEVTVFTIAIMGVSYLLANELPSPKIFQFSDTPSIVLARLGATISALVGIELAIRGHLSPGGGFAAGVAGGTAIGLVAITSSTEMMESIYKKWKASVWEKISVIVFVIISILFLVGFELGQGEFGSLFSGGWITILNILVAVKVTLGSWAAILLFIRYRGLL